MTDQINIDPGRIETSLTEKSYGTVGLVEYDDYTVDFTYSVSPVIGGEPFLSVVITGYDSETPEPEQPIFLTTEELEEVTHYEEEGKESTIEGETYTEYIEDHFFDNMNERLKEFIEFATRVRESPEHEVYTNWHRTEYSSNRIEWTDSKYGNMVIATSEEVEDNNEWEVLEMGVNGKFSIIGTAETESETKDLMDKTISSIETMEQENLREMIRDLETFKETEEVTVKVKGTEYSGEPQHVTTTEQELEFSMTVDPEHVENGDFGQNILEVTTHKKNNGEWIDVVAMYPVAIEGRTGEYDWKELGAVENIDFEVPQ